MGLVINPKTILDSPSPLRSVLPVPLLQVIERGFRQPELLLSIPMSADITGLIHDLVRSPLRGELRAVQLAARSAEMMAFIAHQWSQMPRADGNVAIRRRDSELAAGARRALDARFADPPTTDELAAELGTNRSKLNELFQRSFGITIKHYCIQRRIERAIALLHEGSLNMAQVAQAVGYSHQSSFTAAFRELVGVSPRGYVRQWASGVDTPG
jgi:AraC-like DNA-binding protein